MKEVTVRTLCDRCRNPIPGDPLGGKTVKVGWLGQVVEVDLCEVCVKEMSDLLDWLPTPVRRQSKGGQPGTAGRSACPECGEWFVTNRMNMHMVRVHNYPKGSKPFTSRLDKSGEAYVPRLSCPSCGRTFASQQGLAAHSRIH